MNRSRTFRGALGVGAVLLSIAAASPRPASADRARAHEAVSTRDEREREGEWGAHDIPAFILSLTVLPRVDGWDPTFGHRSGWGVAAGLDLSPWAASTEVHLEFTYLTNGDERLLSFDVGLKIPFHRGAVWEVHGVVGPALAYEHFRTSNAAGELQTEGAFVVGIVAGFGSTFWGHRHFGVTADLNYRVLGGDGMAHRLFTAVGIAARW